MYFQAVPADGVSVWKIASIELGMSMAKRVFVASGVSGAGANAISSALVNIKTPASAAKTTTLRCAFFTLCPCRSKSVLVGRAVRLSSITVSDKTAHDPSDLSSAKGCRSLHLFSKISCQSDFTAFTGRHKSAEIPEQSESPPLTPSMSRLFELILGQRLKAPPSPGRDRLKRGGGAGVTQGDRVDPHGFIGPNLVNCLHKRVVQIPRLAGGDHDLGGIAFHGLLQGAGDLSFAVCGDIVDGALGGGKVVTAGINRPVFRKRFV